jgi:hypothetical protein
MGMLYNLGTIYFIFLILAQKFDTVYQTLYTVKTVGLYQCYKNWTVGWELGTAPVRADVRNMQSMELGKIRTKPVHTGATGDNF